MRLFRILVFFLALSFAGLLVSRSWSLAFDDTRVPAPAKEGIASPSLLPVPPKPVVVEVFPKDGEKEVLLGIEDPMVVRFEASVSQYYIDFTFDPPLPVVFENNSEKTEFRLVPTEAPQEGKVYRLTISARLRENPSGQLIRISESSFSTTALSTQTGSLSAAEALTLARKTTYPKITSGKYIDVNLGKQILTTFEEGKPLESYLISSGKRGMDTPKGEYTISTKALRPWSKRYSLFMPYWMAITGDGKFGIHELPEWPGGYKEGASHLGKPVSHGCIRLGIGAAREVYEWAPSGTPVVIH